MGGILAEQHSRITKEDVAGVASHARQLARASRLDPRALAARRGGTTSHAGLSAEQRASLGIGDGLVRLSVGLEAPDDLVEDLDHALSGA